MSEVYTFKVFTAEMMRAIENGEVTDDTAEWDEIDVTANDRATARQLAEVEALDLYGPGAHLEAMQAGGSAGLVTF